jgi:membrane protein implicated in regulation of membrane protease activity
MPLHLLLYVIAGSLLLVEAFTPGTFIFVCFAVATFITGLVVNFVQIDLTWVLALDLVLSENPC